MFKFLKNFRRGFATNSSSSHSFVYLKDPLGDSSDARYTDNEFGWDDFILDTLLDKLFYVLTSRIGGGWNNSPNYAEECYEKFKDEFPELSKEDFEDAANGYVDHESVGIIDADTARDPRVVIFGGNDNSDGSKERAAVVSSGEVDWNLSEFQWEDKENIAKDDIDGQKAMEKYGY